MKQMIALGLVGLFTHTKADQYSKNVLGGDNRLIGSSFNTYSVNNPFDNYGKNDDVVYGKPGRDGRHGADGSMGSSGPKGAPGSKGAPGDKGAQGDKGLTGKPGQDGTDGAKGAPGQPGKAKNGKDGDKGDAGHPGQPGANGMDGANGTPGQPGKAGARGDKGAAGKNGAAGKPGAQGAKGATGRDGVAGPPGAPGKSRARGRPGPPGAPGPAGKCGCGGGQPHRRDVVVDANYGDIITGGYGGYDNDYYGYGNQQPLSGQANYRPNDLYAPMPDRYNDGYNPADNANVYSSLPANNLGAGYDVEHKQFSKGRANGKAGEVFVISDVETKNKGYNERIGYKGDEVYEDAAGKQQAFQRGEDYQNAGYEGYDKASAYGGDAIYQQDDVAQKATVQYEVDHSLQFRNDYQDENHRGNYKGDEFDVEYQATDVQGGYANKEIDRQSKVAAYEGADANGDIYKGGKYYGDDYLKYGDVDKEGKYKERGHGIPDEKYISDEFYPEEYEEEDEDLYGRYKGEKGVAYDKGKGRGGKQHYPYGEYYKKKGDYSKDADYRGYGANYEGKDYYGKKHDAEAVAGAEEAITDKVAFDKGAYRSVKANGKNKAAQYQGDYQTNKKAHDVDYNVKHYENLDQNVQNDVKSDQYYAKYEGQDYKGGYDAENKYGKYTDKEFNTQQDAKRHGKRYNGESFANKVSQDTEAAIYYHARKDENAARELHADPAGYRGGNGNGDSSRRVKVAANARDSAGEYGYMKFGNRRALLTNELDELRTQIASLSVRNIASGSDIVYGVFALILASIFGGLTFVAIMNLKGYKVNKKNEKDTEALIEG